MRDDNVYESERGERACRACAAENARTRRAKASAERPPRERKRSYRPRGMTREQLVEWALRDNEGPGCWSWREAAVGGEGYVQVPVGGKKVSAHRVVHEVLIGPIPEGFVVDHTCHDPKECPGGPTCPHRQCVNPGHLVAVPQGENSAAERSSRPRPTHCKHGHEFTDENVWTDKRGSRHCLACRRRSNRERREREREGRTDGRSRLDGMCANGHDTAQVGLTPAGRCRECRREASRRYKALAR